jgi:hypothetical protein
MLQTLNAPHEVCGQGRCRFPNHPRPGLRSRERGTVETKPGGCLDELTLAIDEVGHPKDTVAQEDRHLAALALAQELAVEGAGGSVAGKEVHSMYVQETLRVKRCHGVAASFAMLESGAKLIR